MDILVTFPNSAGEERTVVYKSIGDATLDIHTFLCHFGIWLGESIEIAFDTNEYGPYAYNVRVSIQDGVLSVVDSFDPSGGDGLTDVRHDDSVVTFFGLRGNNKREAAALASNLTNLLVLNKLAFDFLPGWEE